MADLRQTPGVLNIAIVFEDELELTLSFNLNLTGYTFDATVVNAVTKAETVIRVSPVDLATGRIQLSMDATASRAVPVGKHRWALRWTSDSGLTRTVLAGVFEVIEA